MVRPWGETKMTKLSTWTNPATGEVRIYVRHTDVEHGDKLFLVPATEPRISAYSATLKVLRGAEYSYRRFGAGPFFLKDAAETIAAKALAELGLARTASWDDLVARAA
jgi:hypothetical protein